MSTVQPKMPAAAHEPMPLVAESVHPRIAVRLHALKDGDTQRAHTLAVKAHLLSDDLLKH